MATRGSFGASCCMMARASPPSLEPSRLTIVSRQLLAPLRTPVGRGQTRRDFWKKNRDGHVLVSSDEEDEDEKKEKKKKKKSSTCMHYRYCTGV